LNSIAESEGFKTTGKGNPWPKDNLQLRERTREIAPQLRKTSNILIEIRSNKNTNEFIVGHREGVENYLEVIREEGEGDDTSQDTNITKVEDIQDASKITVDTCALIVQEKNGEAIRGDNLLKEVSQNTSVQVYMGGKFTLETNWKLKKIFIELAQRPSIERVCEKPYMFKWNKDSVLSSGESEVIPEKQCNVERISSFYYT
jgi:hypothetical protein